MVVADTSGRLRIEPASQFSFDGMMMTGEIDGETVTVYSGRHDETDYSFTFLLIPGLAMAKGVSLGLTPCRFRRR